MKPLDVLLFTYLFYAFILAEFNPLSWTKEQRITFIWAWAINCIITIIIKKIKDKYLQNNNK